jgi:hypothetical protein
MGAVKKAVLTGRWYGVYRPPTGRSGWPVRVSSSNPGTWSWTFRVDGNDMYYRYRRSGYVPSWVLEAPGYWRTEGLTRTHPTRRRSPLMTITCTLTPIRDTRPTLGYWIANVKPAPPELVAPEVALEALAGP